MKAGRIMIRVMLILLLLLLFLPLLLLIEGRLTTLPLMIWTAGTALVALSVALQVFWALYELRGRDPLAARHIESVGMAAFEHMMMPMLLTRRSGEILWSNEMFSEHFNDGLPVTGRSLQETIHLNPLSLDPSNDLLMRHENKSYQVHTTPSGSDPDVLAIQFQEVTALLQLKEENTGARPCVLLFLIDGYDDLVQSAKESEKAAVAAGADRVLEEFMRGTDGVLRKVDNDFFFAVMESRHLHERMQAQFSILEEAHRVQIGDRMHLSFSIGVGDGAKSLAENERFAGQALDMALGRGGDQVAVRTQTGYSFFGGTSKGVEKKSKVKIRSVAVAMQDVIEVSDQVLLMGHRFGDLDSIGSCCGMAAAVMQMHKRAAIVTDRESCLAQELIERMEAAENPPEFISEAEALRRLTPQTLLIICDTHNRAILESLTLYERTKNIIVIDHHRKAVNFIDNAVIFHHEPNASSAAEMVTELVQYFNMKEEISGDYADALLSGIMLDTKNFIMRTGVRTFEAAAYLKKRGADTVQVKTLFAGTISEYAMRSQIVSHAEIYYENAISVVKLSDEKINGRLIASQAADDLLNIKGVTASFVIYTEPNGVGISARSLGNVNVQIIMEQMHGGGHQNMAATFFKGGTIQDAKEQLLFILERTRQAGGQRKPMEIEAHEEPQAAL